MTRNCLEVSLTQAYLDESLTEAEIVIKFFRNINLVPDKKDYFIREFEDFYFKVRPKLTAQLIRVLLEVKDIVFKIFISGWFKEWNTRSSLSNKWNWGITDERMLHFAAGL